VQSHSESIFGSQLIDWPFPWLANVATKDNSKKAQGVFLVIPKDNTGELNPAIHLYIRISDVLPMFPGPDLLCFSPRAAALVSSMYRTNIILSRKCKKTTPSQRVCAMYIIYVQVGCGPLTQHASVQQESHKVPMSSLTPPPPGQATTMVQLDLVHRGALEVSADVGHSAEPASAPLGSVPAQVTKQCAMTHEPRAAARQAEAEAAMHHRQAAAC